MEILGLAMLWPCVRSPAWMRVLGPLSTGIRTWRPRALTFAATPHPWSVCVRIAESTRSWLADWRRGSLLVGIRITLSIMMF